MSTADDELPDGWSRVEDDEVRTGQYDARRPIRYACESTECFLQPVTNPPSEAGEADGWNLGVGRPGGTDETHVVREGLDGRDTAIDAAREFMATYNRRCVDGGDSIEDVVGDF